MFKKGKIVNQFISCVIIIFKIILSSCNEKINSYELKENNNIKKYAKVVFGQICLDIKKLKTVI